MRRNLCALALFAAAMIAPSIARAETTVSQFKGISTYASFTSADPGGCIFTYTDISVYENATRTSGTASSYSVASLYIFQYDYCTYTLLRGYFGYTYLEPNAFDTRGRLRSARLVTTMDVIDYQTNVTSQVSIDLAWTAVGEVQHGNSHYRTSYPNYSSISHQVGSSSMARVAGTVALDNTNLTPQPSDYASIYESRSGNVVITH